MATDASLPSVAFLGVGAMGAPMATRLLNAGFALRVWNRSPGALVPLVEQGAVAAASPKDAAMGVDIVVTMLPDGQVVEEVMLGEEGAVRGLREGATWLQMSSVGVEWSERLAALAATHALAYVDAPVSGSTGPAKDGTLIVLASGPEGARAIAAPVFDALGKETAWLGAAGAGSRAKLVLNNWLVDLVEATAEMLHFARALGLEPGTVVDLLDDAPIGSPYAVAKGRLMLQGDFTSNFALKHALKDAKLSLDAAGAAKVELRLTESLLPAWQRALDEGDGDLDLSVIYRREGSTTSPH